MNIYNKNKKHWSQVQMMGCHHSLEGTLFTSEKCPGGQYSPVNNVQGDIIHSDNSAVTNVLGGHYSPVNIVWGDIIHQ